MQVMQFTPLFGRKEYLLCIEVYLLLPWGKLQIKVSDRRCKILASIDESCTLGANFTAYQEIKKLAHKMQPDFVELPSYQHMVIGLISGAMGPFSNAPIDTIKTRKFFFHPPFKTR